MDMMRTLSDALRDRWGDSDFFGWPEPNTDCMGGDKLAVFSLAGAEASPRPRRPCTGYLQAEARASEQEILLAGVDRCEGEAAPSQPRDVLESGARPARHGQLARGAD